MAAVSRESRFMPTVKCSTCGSQVEISLMGEHVCPESGSPAESTPPLPEASLFGRLLPAFSNPLAPKRQEPRSPPQVDTSAANRVYVAPGELTPLSQESGSQSGVSPEFPNVRPDAGKTNGLGTPGIVNNSSTPPQSARPGGYGGLDDDSDYEDAVPQTSASEQEPDMTDRRDAAKDHLDVDHQPSAPGFGPGLCGPPGYGSGYPSTPASYIANRYGGGGTPNPQDGNGKYIPYSRPPEQSLEPPRTPNRAETFPRPSERFGPPARTPSAPTHSPLGPSGAPGEQDRMADERPRRPSRGVPDTSRPPPPRTNPVRPSTPGVPRINLAEEFGIGNPYHNPSESTSSTNSSEHSSQPERRPSQASQASQASSRTSPPRSLASRGGTSPSSERPNVDSLMKDITRSMDEMGPKPPAPAPIKIPRGMFPKDRPSPLSARPPRPGERGYDPRIDPAVQNSRLGKGKSPLPLSIPENTPQAGLMVHSLNDALSPSTPVLPSPRWAGSPERGQPASDRRPSQAPSEPQPSAQPQAPPQRPPPPEPSPENVPEQTAESTRSPARSQPREPASTSSRGNCRACNQAITGKSISSADGRLTGRYHKSCFVCTTCRQPFSSSTFYVLDDKPYCELHYHRLNGSLCGSCGRGIEGQYLEDASGVKHHVGCFKCGMCRMALRDGYFEVNGKAYCEQDAWRLASGGMNGAPPHPPGPGGMGFRPPHMGPPGGPRGGPMGGGYNPSRLGPMGQRPKMEKRMTRLGMM